MCPEEGRGRLGAQEGHRRSTPMPAESQLQFVKDEQKFDRWSRATKSTLGRVHSTYRSKERHEEKLPLVQYEGSGRRWAEVEDQDRARWRVT